VCEVHTGGDTIPIKGGHSKGTNIGMPPPPYFYFTVLKYSQFSVVLALKNTQSSDELLTSISFQSFIQIK